MQAGERFKDGGRKESKMAAERAKNDGRKGPQPWKLEKQGN